MTTGAEPIDSQTFAKLWANDQGGEHVPTLVRAHRLDVLADACAHLSGDHALRLAVLVAELASSLGVWDVYERLAAQLETNLALRSADPSMPSDLHFVHDIVRVSRMRYHLAHDDREQGRAYASELIGSTRGYARHAAHCALGVWYQREQETARAVECLDAAGTVFSEDMDDVLRLRGPIAGLCRSLRDAGVSGLELDRYEQLLAAYQREGPYADLGLDRDDHEDWQLR